MTARDPALEAFDMLIYGKSTADMEEFLPGTSSRRRRVESPKPVREVYLDTLGTEYALKYQEEEKRKTEEAAAELEGFVRARAQGPGMSVLEEASTFCGDMLHVLEDEPLQMKTVVYTEYDFKQHQRKGLAIDSKKEEILATLKKENALVIKGFTGCGKTTQVPQFILDECFENKTPCNIVVTQPRRIAAISIAKRVCEERSWPVGSVVGYQVGMEKQTNPLTCLTYMTTGCLLEMLVSKKSLDGFTHIIIDEVHERDEDTDFLLLVVRKFLRHTRTNARVIMMSATVEGHKFAHYYEYPFNRVWRNAPVIEVESKSVHPVRMYYLNDLANLPFLSATVPPRDAFDPCNAVTDKQCYDVATRLICAFDEKREITRFGRSANYAHISGTRGAVLVFLPGVAEIEKMHKTLVEFEQKADENNKNYWYILPLHSRITSEEQSRVFLGLPTEKSYYRKIILSTNIAESSLTVPDIIYVIDFCLIKQLVTDKDTNYVTLKTEWAPKSNCDQRKGRVGRVNEGVVYRMVYQEFYTHNMASDATPEILRCPLEQAILRTKLLDLGTPVEMLALMIDPPPLDSVARTIMSLKEVGALFATIKGKWDVLDGDLSYLGRVMARLPIDVHLGKLIMFGYIFNILDECVIMAAGLSSKNIFTSPFQKKLLAYHVKMSWAEGSFSDPITILNAYQLYKSLVNNEHFKRSGQSEYAREREWANRYFIQLKNLKEMDLLVNELKKRLTGLGIESPVGPNIRPLTVTQKALLLRIAIYGAFYPNYFARTCPVLGEDCEREAVKSLGGLDPFSTVRLQGFPDNVPTKAYIRQIKSNMAEIFQMLSEDTWNAKIAFAGQRVYIQFSQEGQLIDDVLSVPGKICLPVYLALKQKQLGMNYEIKMLDSVSAERYVSRVEMTARRMLGFNDRDSVASSRSGYADLPYVLQIPPARLPDMNESELAVSVCHADTPDSFYCHRLDPDSRRDYKHINEIIGEGGRLVSQMFLRTPVQKGNLVLAPFGDGPEKTFYRAKVIRLKRGPTGKPDSLVRVYFIDFGNVAEVNVHDLRSIPESLLHFPPLAFQCRLVGIGPSYLNDPHGKWTKEAKVSTI